MGEECSTIIIGVYMGTVWVPRGIFPEIPLEEFIGFWFGFHGLGLGFKVYCLGFRVEIL